VLQLAMQSTHCNTTATDCNRLQHIALFCCRCRFPRVCWYALIATPATHCITLQRTTIHTTTDCYTLQHIALFGCRYRLPGVCWYPLSATYCNTLHHAAMHCKVAKQSHTLPIEHIVYTRTKVQNIVSFIGLFCKRALQSKDSSRTL